MTTDYMLTTVDNPFDPFTQFHEWYEFDTHNGYHTSAFLARVAMISPDISEADQTLAIEQAMEEIIQENVSGMWRIVTREITAE